MGFLHVGQAGLELSTSGDPPVAASQSAMITVVTHGARLMLGFLNSIRKIALLSCQREQFWRGEVGQKDAVFICIGKWENQIVNSFS